MTMLCIPSHEVDDIARRLVSLFDAQFRRRRSREQGRSDAEALGRTYGRTLIAAGFGVRRGFEESTLLRRCIEESVQRHAGGVSADVWALRDSLAPLFDAFLMGLAAAYDEVRCRGTRHAGTV
ncbi:MAG: hypothetical protein ACRDJE_16450 [Dehalococcoidia bacterium]